MLNLVLLLSVLLNVVPSYGTHKAEVQTKRILLNDPDIFTSRLTQIEKKLQDMNQLTTHIQAELTKETARSASLQTTVSQLEKELKEERSKTSQIISDRGSTYIQWGRKHCTATNSETVYSGFSAGDRYVRGNTAKGGPANTLCLPNNPEISNRTAPGSSFICGTEFEDGDFFGKGAQDEDVPCALCRSQNTSSTVMIPGRKTCYSGWNMEYNGILAAGAYTHKPSSYICIDSSPEYLQAGKQSTLAHLLYGVRTECGPLPCPPYVNNMAVNCVVCSK